MLTSTSIARSAATALADGGTAKDRAQVPAHANKRFDAILHVIEVVLRDMPNADPATRVALARLTEALARIVNLPAQPQESLKDFTRRLAAHMDVLPPAARALIEKQLNQQSLLSALKALIETLRPTLSIELPLDLPLPHDIHFDAEPVLEDDGPVFRRPAIQVPLPTRPVFSQAPGVAPGAPHLQQALGQAFSPEKPAVWTAEPAAGGTGQIGEETLPAFREATAFLASDTQALAQAVAIARGHAVDGMPDLVSEPPALADAAPGQTGSLPNGDLPEAEAIHPTPDAAAPTELPAAADATASEHAEDMADPLPPSTEADHVAPARSSRDLPAAMHRHLEGAPDGQPETVHAGPAQTRPPPSPTSPPASPSSPSRGETSATFHEAMSSSDGGHPDHTHDRDVVGGRQHAPLSTGARPEPQMPASFEPDLHPAPPLSSADLERTSPPSAGQTPAAIEERLGSERRPPDATDRRATVILPAIDVALLKVGAMDVANTMGQLDEWETLFYMLSGSLGEASEPVRPEPTHAQMVSAEMESAPRTASPQSAEIDMLTPRDGETGENAAHLPPTSEEPVPGTPLARGMDSIAVREAIAFAFVPYLPAGDHAAVTEDDDGPHRDRDDPDDARDRHGKDGGEKGETDEPALVQTDAAPADDADSESRDAYDLYRRLSDLA